MIRRINNPNTNFSATAAKFPFDALSLNHSLNQATQHTLRPKVWTDCIIEEEE
jgi:hypothetical protein